jgi:hypothetical protein
MSLARLAPFPIPHSAFRIPHYSLPIRHLNVVVSSVLIPNSDSSHLPAMLRIALQAGVTEIL